MVTDLESQIERLQNIGGSRLVQDGPGGRVFSGKEPEQAKRAVYNEQRYDVVATNGLTHDGAPAWNFLTVEQDLGGIYQRLASGLTAAEVNSTTFRWGRGLAFTNFGCAAVPAGIICDAGWWASDLEDHNLPAEIVMAFAYGTIFGPGGVSLTLTIGVV